VALAVLVDRGGRELPIEPAFAAARLAGGAQRLSWHAMTRAGSRSRRVGGILMLLRRNPQLNRHGELIHLLSIEGLPRRC